MESKVEKNIERRKKSVVIPDEILVRYNEWLGKQHTLRDAADVIGLDPQSLKPIALRGTCSPDTLEKIKSVLYGEDQPA